MNHLNIIDCVCVLHGDKYRWEYVEKLYAMVRRHVPCEVRFHVFTEESRPVSNHMIKHVLTEWPGISGPRKSWWYKMQVFNPRHIAGPVLYLDLDIMIVDNLDWMLALDTQYFWIIRDWKYLWYPGWTGTNSSVMYWDTTKFDKIWSDFCQADINEITKKYRGDQEYITEILDEGDRCFFPDDFLASWRWQVKDGGLDRRKNIYKSPGAGGILHPNNKIVVFHGSPKPHEIDDALVLKFWRGEI